MSDQFTNTRAEVTGDTPAPTPSGGAGPPAAELAQFQAWKAEQMAAQGLDPAVVAGEAPAPSTLDASAYDFKVGDVVATSTGYGIVVAQGVEATTGVLLAAYVVASLGQANETPATSESLGLAALGDPATKVL